jgi:iron complex transport system substrate-binding protein
MRIVSLLPSATEILFAIGAGEEVVGITHECDYPPRAQHLPKLTSSTLDHDGTPGSIDRHVRTALHAGSSLYHLDAAALAQLAPDLIVTQELCSVCAVSYEIVARAVKRLPGDPRVVSLEPSSLQDVFSTMTFLGQCTGHQGGAQALVDRLQHRLDHLDREVADALRDTNGARAGVLLLEWTDPPMSAGHWAPELIQRAGGTPLLAHPGANSQRLTWEDIASADPDIVIVAPCGFDLQATRTAVAALREQPQWLGLRAHQTSEAYLLDGNAFLNRPGPRLIDTAEIFATMLFADALDLPIVDPHAWEPFDTTVPSEPSRG